MLIAPLFAVGAEVGLEYEKVSHGEQNTTTAKVRAPGGGTTAQNPLGQALAMDGVWQEKRLGVDEAVDHTSSDRRRWALVQLGARC
jgi:hypothetical protein